MSDEARGAQVRQRDEEAMGRDGEDGAAVEAARGRRGGRERTPEKAAAILGGAMREFLVHGYAAASMDRVAAAAGVSKATVYGHYGDKDHLFAALVEQLAREKARAIFDAPNVARFEGDPRDVLRGLLATMHAAISSDPDFVAFLRLVVGESGRFPALMGSFVERVHQPLIARLGAYLAAHPEWRLADPEAVARIAFGALFYDIVITVMLRPEGALPPTSSSTERERLIAGLVDLLAPRATASPSRPPAGA